MAMCPNCNAEISQKKLWRHSWFTPISCDQCGTKLQFNKAQYYRLILPLILLALATPLVILSTPNTTELQILLSIGAISILMILNIVALLRFRTGINAIELKPYKK